jgi:hypothetical protein
LPLIGNVRLTPNSLYQRNFRTLRACVMADDHEFRVRPGRIRSTRAQSARPFIAQALAAAKAGGGVSRSGRVVAANRSRFGRGQRASIQANRFITARTRGAVIKARVVRLRPHRAAGHASRLSPPRWRDP